MTAEDFISHVAAHAGVAIGKADAATRKVLSALGGHLTDPGRQLVAEELPADLRGALLHPMNAALPIEERLLESGKNVGHARELIASVCRVLAEELSTEALASLRSVVRADLSRFLVEPAREATHEEIVIGMRDTLSCGKPGSHHPLSDARFDRRQSESVASSNPHADPSRTLSTAKRV